MLGFVGLEALGLAYPSTAGYKYICCLSSIDWMETAHMANGELEAQAGIR